MGLVVNLNPIRIRLGSGILTGHFKFKGKQCFSSYTPGPGSLLASRLNVSRKALPELSTRNVTPASLQPPISNRDLLRHLSALLTRHGSRGEPIVAAVQATLQVRYGVADPIRRALDAVKPVIKYYKSKVSRQYIPLALYPKVADAMALRWIINAAGERTFVGGRPNITRGLTEEIEAIIQGTSSLYAKRFATHRNPN